MDGRRDIDYPQAARFKLLMGDSAQIGLMLRRGNRVASFLDRRTNPNVILGGGDENFITSRNYEIAAGMSLSGTLVVSVVGSFAPPQALSAAVITIAIIVRLAPSRTRYQTSCRMGLLMSYKVRTHLTLT